MTKKDCWKISADIEIMFGVATSVNYQMNLCTKNSSAAVFKWVAQFFMIMIKPLRVKSREQK